MIRYRLSRYWNRLAYAFILLGRRMVWDPTGRNHDLLTRSDFGSEYSEAIFCGRDKKYMAIMFESKRKTK